MKIFQYTVLHTFQLAILSATPVLSVAQEVDNQPNIVVFIADDVGMELGCYGYKGAHTPNLDRLAGEGIKFNNAFLTASSCSPSRTSLLSGHFAHTIGTEDLHTGINDSTNILPTYLKRLGYYTGYMLKGHFGSNAHEQFDWYDNGFWPDWARDSSWNAKALENFNAFLDNADSKPFFLWIGFTDAHRPYHMAESRKGNRAPEVNDPSKVFVPPYLIDDKQTRVDLAHYHDEVTRMDQHIGNMVQALDEQGKLDNTLIIFLSDNGKPFPRAKGTCYDSGIKTPFIFYWKNRIKNARDYDGLVSALHLSPTVLDAAGYKNNHKMYGRSLLPVLDNGLFEPDQYVFAERNWHNADEHIRAIRTDRYLLIINSYTELPHGSPSDVSTSPAWYSLQEMKEAKKLNKAQQWLFNTPRHKIELYDVVNDPFQTHNLSGNPDYLEISNQLTEILVQWMESTDDHPSFLRRKEDIVDRLSGFPIKGDRNFSLKIKNRNQYGYPQKIERI